MKEQLKLTLSNGVEMPMAGIGTFLLTRTRRRRPASAPWKTDTGSYTANAYVNERAVGRAMRKSGLDRKEIFLETKLWPAFYEQPDAVEKTLERLDTDCIDLLLIHQPRETTLPDTGRWRRRSGRGRSGRLAFRTSTRSRIREILLHLQDSFRAPPDRGPPLLPGEEPEGVPGF